MPVSGGRNQSNAALEAMLAEYAALRNEIVESTTNRVTVMNFTFGALSVLVAGLVTTASVSRLIVGLVALFLVPQMAKAGLLIWLGEYRRSQRAGRWIARLEEKINQAVGSGDVVGWENYLKRNKAHMLYPYVGAFVFTLGAGYAGTLFGGYLLTSEFLRRVHSVNLLAGIPIVVYVLVLEVSFLRFVQPRWRQAKTGEGDEPLAPASTA